MDRTKILIIQTAFIGDVVLATPVIEKLHQYDPGARLDFVLRKGNENLLEKHPYLEKVYVWDKKKKKIRNLIRIIRSVRKEKYDLVINLQRFFATGLLTVLSGGKKTIGYRKNPLSFLFDERHAHLIGEGTHETDRNLSLIASVTGEGSVRPRLHVGEKNYDNIRVYQGQPYLTIAPTSVWFTKQFPAHKWIDFIKSTDFKGIIYLLGGPADHSSCEFIRTETGKEGVVNLCGKLSFLDSAALMEGAVMNYVNDSAPQHFASAVNAPVSAIFCSTVVDFGFGPLSEKSRIIETGKRLQCRPCGLHGYKKCPEGHFECAESIEIDELIKSLPR